MTHTIIDFISPVSLERVERLRDLLREVSDRIRTNSFPPFASLQRLHFASLVVHVCPTFGARLIFEHNFDGDLESYLTELCHAGKDEIDRIYGHCSDYHAADGENIDTLTTYLKAHAVRPNAFHVGNTGRTCPRILNERALRENLETFADTLTDLERSAAATTLFAKFRSHAERVFPFVRESGSRDNPQEKRSNRMKFAAFVLSAVAMAILFLPITIALIAVLLWKEATDAVVTNSADLPNLSKLVEGEDRSLTVQNHMASIAEVKPGWLRLSTLKIVLHAVNLLARVRATNGQLSGITSIHFAHWVLIDEGRRLLFLSNFDGSWENYLDDFIDKASPGLTGIWSNTVGFPRTRFLFTGGAKDASRFKAIARDSMTVTNAWYQAYPSLTVQGIDNNSSLREGLGVDPDPSASAAWLQRL